MKNLKLALLCMAVGLAVCLCGGCEPKGADIGDLYGRWHLESIDSHAGSIGHNDTIFVSFQGTAYQYLVGWGHFDWGTYRKTADSLVLNALAYGGNFEALGIQHWPSDWPLDFHLDELTDDDLVLSRHDTVWCFSKFLE